MVGFMSKKSLLYVRLSFSYYNKMLKNNLNSSQKSTSIIAKEPTSGEEPLSLQDENTLLKTQIESLKHQLSLLPSTCLEKKKEFGFVVSVYEKIKASEIDTYIHFLKSSLLLKLCKNDVLQDYEAEKQKTFVITANMTRQYKLMRDELTNKIDTLTEIIEEKNKEISLLQTEKNNLEKKAQSQIKEKNEEIEEWKKKMEDMAHEFGQMLKVFIIAFFDKMSERIVLAQEENGEETKLMIGIQQKIDALTDGFTGLENFELFHQRKKKQKKGSSATPLQRSETGQHYVAANPNTTGTNDNRDNKKELQNVSTKEDRTYGPQEIASMGCFICTIVVVVIILLMYNKQNTDTTLTTINAPLTVSPFFANKMNDISKLDRYTDEEIANLTYVNSARLKIVQKNKFFIFFFYCVHLLQQMKKMSVTHAYKFFKVLLLGKKKDFYDVHIVISSGCSEQQNWESEVLLYSWARLKHPGQITRIVSGCQSLKEKLLAMDTAIVSERVHFFFSPDYTPGENEEERNLKGGGSPFHYFNKPFGMHKFLQEVELLESYLVLLDPDMIITKIFDFHFSQSLPEHLQVTLPKLKQTTKTLLRGGPKQSQKKKLRKGHPISQLYGIGDKWITWGLCTTESCKKVDEGTAWKHYSVGPPYMMHTDDWKLIVPKWVEYSPPSLEKDPPPSILAEMYSYALACAHYDLKHQMLFSMVSDPETSSSLEPWDKLAWGFLNDTSDLTAGMHIIHYCHGYWLGTDRPSGHLKTSGFNFHKGHVPSDILHNCDIPLLVEVPLHKLAFEKDSTDGHHHVWMLHQVLTRINSALINYKRTKCKDWKPEYKTVLLQPEKDPLNRMHYFLDTDTVYK
ncbi:hypothetical protein RFI_03976 [Reticulomyxa filosa]|uniref:Uncharacterized protein n=1 Tax=Reticulomyxa filosa TaxID=46433 RepID=X6P3L1_RETFI|nr:hypothetical protein RFI_03976 [Reticulomyxa filosa]|eukprot:ETO33130.1 hypothetical protein RFI_03976 [Reticulomyxa filosa]